MRIEYITVSGKPIVYNYTWNKVKNRPKCLNCGRALNGLTYRKKNKEKRIGYICKYCKNIYIYNKYGKIISINRIKVVK